VKHDMQPFIEGCAAMQIALDEQKRAAFETYLSLLLEWNQKFNLTAIREPRQIMVQHFLDSISLLQLDIIQEEDSVLDLGSGAGFPGIPIKIMLPQISLTLVDSVQKKVRFLNEAIKQLNLDQSEALHARAEDLAREADKREAYDVVVSRAVGEMRVLAEYCLPFVKQDGYFISHKGPGAADELALAGKALSILKGKWLETRQVDIPFSERTHNLVVVKKTGKTPKLYPRSAGLPKKTPL